MTEQQEKDLQAALVECRRFVSAEDLAAVASEEGEGGKLNEANTE